MEKANFQKVIPILIVIGLFCLFFLMYLLFMAEPNSTEVTKLQIEILKIVLVSVVVSLLGIIIPQVLASERHQTEMKLTQERHETEMKLAKKRLDLELKRQEFELKKEGRRLYSVVKTGLDYLPDRLSGMDYQEAIQHIENIHQAYHLVMLYPDDEKKGNFETYFDEYKAYKKLNAAKKSLSQKPNETRENNG